MVLPKLYCIREKTVGRKKTAKSETVAAVWSSAKRRFITAATWRQLPNLEPGEWISTFCSAITDLFEFASLEVDFAFSVSKVEESPAPPFSAIVVLLSLYE